jgi:hypothetical protein
VKFIFTINGDDFIKLYFNLKGMLIKKECKFFENKEIYDNYIYDKQNRLVSYNTYWRQDTIKYICKYDSAGFLTKVIIKDAAEEWESVHYKYDKKGNRIEEYKTNFHPTKKIYNTKNQIIEEWESGKDTIRAFGEDETHISNFEGNHRLYGYNQFGDVSRRMIKNENCTDIITYIYDEKRNWIDRKSSDFECFLNFSGNVDAGNIDGAHCTRVIEYYE